MRFAPAIAALLFPVAVGAQASPYVALDDPRLPAFEHLIAVGDVADPSPMIRPFRRADAMRMLDSAYADPDTRDTALVAALRLAWRPDSGDATWRLLARAGAQAYTEGRRDPLHRAGQGSVEPYLEIGMVGRWGNLLAVSRPAIERRLLDDPDWPGRKNLDVTGRQIDGYISAQFRWLRLFYGQMDRNWGPVGLPGFGVSNYGYSRPELGIELGNDRFRLSAHAASLTDATDSLGQTVHRYFFAHRADVRLHSRLRLGLWETVVLAGVDRNFDGRYRNPVTLLLLANQYGLGDQGNILMGLDLHWHAGRRLALQGQFALDDFQYQNRSGPTRVPDRYGFTLAATGPLVRRIGWRAAYTQATSLAFRASDPFENLTDGGVGLGRNFSGNDQLSLSASALVARHWLVTPELTLLRQGDATLNDPFPQGTARGNTPTLFIGTVERTWRAALGLSGEQGRLALRGNMGVHLIDNADHVAGRSRTRFVGQLTATLALGAAGQF
ncbi:MAG: hypothetical protein ABI587_09765 [Gemmatimonadales bacterium]